MQASKPQDEKFATETLETPSRQDLNKSEAETKAGNPGAQQGTTMPAGVDNSDQPSTVATSRDEPFPAHGNLQSMHEVSGCPAIAVSAFWC